MLEVNQKYSFSRVGLGNEWKWDFSHKFICVVFQTASHLLWRALNRNWMKPMCLGGWWNFHSFRSPAKTAVERLTLFPRYEVSASKRSPKSFSRQSTQENFLRVSFPFAKEKQLKIHSRKRFDPFCWRIHFQYEKREFPFCERAKLERRKISSEGD